LVKDVPKPEKASAIILEHLKMPEENFRLGKTKVSLTTQSISIKKY